MSLRAARSLPSLRNAFQQSLRESLPPPVPKINVQEFSSSAAWNAKKPVNPLMATRNVHQTAQKKSTLLSSNNNRYGSMNLQALKSECRNRGIKISGKKLDLIQRLSTNDQSKLMQHENTRSVFNSTGDKKATKEQFKEFQKTITRKLSSKKIEKKDFSTTTDLKAKGDSSSVDSLKFPSADYVEPPEKVSAPSLLSKDPVKHIDVIETKTKIAEMEGAVSVGGDKEGEVASFQNMFKNFKIDEAVGTESEVVEQKFEASEEEVQPRDKMILGGIFGGIIAWWALKPKSDKK